MLNLMEEQRVLLVNVWKLLTILKWKYTKQNNKILIAAIKLLKPNKIF